MILLRGFSSIPEWPGIEEIYGMRCAAIAEYPMFKNLVVAANDGDKDLVMYIIKRMHDAFDYREIETEKEEAEEEI